MPDITMCINHQCGMAESCWRYCCPPSHWQSVCKFEPKRDDEEFECDYFIPFPEETDFSPSKA
jgi:hypothetical protein